MKKFINFITILILSTSLISCRAKAPNTASDITNNAAPNAIPNDINNNKTTNPKITRNTPNNGGITDTRDISYLPPYIANLMPDNNYPHSKEHNGYNVAVYTIKNSKSSDVFKKYETILRSDGWAIYQDTADRSISAKKGNHDVKIIIKQSHSDVKLTISSK